MDSAMEAAAKALSRYEGNGEFITSIPRAREVITAYLAAKEAAGSVMVPVEPTLEMLEPFGIHKATVARNYCELIAARPREEDR